MIRNFCFILFIISVRLNGQVTEFSKYDWNTSPVKQDHDTLKSYNGALITLDRHIKEVYVNKENLFEEITVLHRKIRVETHDAVNAANKIYIPVDNVIEILKIKARFISPAGKIIELPQESIREVKNLEDAGDYKTFAIEGAEVGGEIEYFYTLRKKFQAYGAVYMQGIEPRENVEVIVAFPSKLEYRIKSYNGFPDFSISTNDSTGITYMKAKTDYIPSLTDEKYSYYNASLMRFEFTLAYNNFISSLRTYSWSVVCSNIYTNIYELTRDEKSAVKQVIKKLQLENLETEKRIRQIEEWIKSEIAITENLDENPSIDQVITLKQTNKNGATRLMAALLNEANIKFELVVTCNQVNREFDPDFNGWNFLDDYLIYFPDLDKIIVPSEQGVRLGIVPFNYQGAFALFLHPISYNEQLKTLAYDVRKIPVADHKKNADSLLINLNINLHQMTLEAVIHRVMTGELAASFQSFWQFGDEENHKNVINSMFNMGNQNTTIAKWSIQNEKPDQIGITPIIWDVDLTAHSLLEIAGDDIIVKIGESIGEQSELYQDSERKLPIRTSASHNYYRKIEFHIPDGYFITNLSDLNMNVEMMNNNSISCCFKSWYEINNDRLIIFSKEYYTELGYPAERFEDYRKVINAAADFNKKTIVLTRK